MKVIIVGGVAGGASCAARLRRLDEKIEILMVERGPFVSYANCGLPYYVGGSIDEESKLLVATEQMFKVIFNMDCRTNCEVVGISAKEKTVKLKNHLRVKSQLKNMINWYFLPVQHLFVLPFPDSIFPEYFR